MSTEFPVTSCPWNPDSWHDASIRLNCSKDRFGRNLYQCAPNAEKSSLVEFCLQGSIGRFEKGLCVHSMSNGYIGVEKCDHFVHGCPEISYISNEIYKYPACLEINADEHCYVADPSCPNISRVQETSTEHLSHIVGNVTFFINTSTNIHGTTTTRTTSDLQNTAILVGVLGSILLILLIGLIVYFSKARGQYKLVNKDEEICSVELDDEEICSVELDEENLAKIIEERGIDFILEGQLEDAQHESIAKMLHIPVEILRWPKEDLEKFVKNLREGETKVYSGRCMVVGCGGAGKTTLVNNLRGEPDVNPLSTIGIDCHPNVFKVNDNKALIVTTDEEKAGQCTQICMKNLTANAEITKENADILNSDSNTSDSVFEINDDEMGMESSESVSKVYYGNMEQMQSFSTPTESNELQELIVEGSDTFINKIKMVDVDDDAEKHTGKDIQSEALDVAQDILKPIRKEEIERNKERKKNKDVIPVESNENRKISIMDFAGQSVYYASHHIYFSPRAFFIVVVDMSKDLNDLAKDSSLNSELMYSGWSYLDYLKYWLGSIHTYSSKDVPVILVASHSEDISETENVYYKEIRKKLPAELLEHLSLERMFKVKKEKDANIEKIKKCIVDILEKQPYWGERIPTSWVSLEQILLREKSRKVWKTDDIWKYVNGNENCKIKKKDDLLAALNFFNDIGVILFNPQGKLGENIILDVQWFVDAFKCIIVDEEHKHMLNRSNHEWDFFDSNGILHKSLLEEAWKGSSFINHKEELILHMINLGMMAELPEKKYYVPCVNKQRYAPNILKDFKVSSTICFMFQYLPLVIFHRLIATCMQKYGWKIWQGNQPETTGFERQANTNTDYCIYHTATIFLADAYKILIGVNEKLKTFGDTHPYLIELQIIVFEGEEIESSKSTEIRNKVEGSLCELLSYYRINKISDLYKIGYRCCEKPFGTLTGHTILSTKNEEERNSFQECIKCKRKIDMEKLTSFWKVSVDCVATLPRTRSGNQDLLTTMCTSTSFPEAVSLWKTKKDECRMEEGPFYLFVAAIDLGTTHSGVAFSSRNAFTAAPTDVWMKTWQGAITTYKTPTAVLFDQNEDFASFGYEAEKKYTELLLDNMAEGWNFFRRFKISLYDQQAVLDSLELVADNGNKMSALKVFSASIKYLWEQLNNEIAKQVFYLIENDVKWVITVPAIWSQPAKSFIRKAAIMAGLQSEMLTIALEPEAAAIFLKHLPLERKKLGGIGDNFRSFSPGSRYIIVDAGGGIIDITIHEILDDGSVKELFQSSGGDWGGIKVNNRIMEFFEDVLGIQTISALRQGHQVAMLELERNIERAKRSLTQKKKMTIIIPAVILELYKQNHDGADLSSVKCVTQRNGKAIQVTFRHDRLILDQETSFSFFEESINSICSLLGNMLYEIAELEINTIIMVGGYANCYFLTSTILKEFPDKHVIVPEEAEWPVLKGAVMFGHDPWLIKQRRSRYTYGVKCKRIFKEGKHDPGKKVEENGRVFCKDLFSKHVEIGELITVGEYQTNKIYRISHEAKSKIHLFASLNSNPKYVTDEGCFKVGELEVSGPDLKVGSKTRVQLSFSHTEIEARISHRKSGKSTVLYLDINS